MGLPDLCPFSCLDMLYVFHDLSSLFESRLCTFFYSLCKQMILSHVACFHVKRTEGGIFLSTNRLVQSLCNTEMSAKETPVTTEIDGDFGILFWGSGGDCIVVWLRS